jgi:LPPG:FO 2-phospho-L-lactate transferase
MNTGKVLALSGGIGGAKLALGLYRILAPRQLTVVANTGDDFEHFGLPVSPDLDTLMYTLSGLNNPETGWGRAHETWTFMQAMAALGGEQWFALGDGDLATHIERRQRLQQGQKLSEITDYLCRCLNITARLLPMSDDPVRTMVQVRETGQILPFQHYFVRQRCEPQVSGFHFAGIETARPNPAFLQLLADPELVVVIICPSNPFISIDPILQLPGVGQALRNCPAPIIAVSPIIGGMAVKGPTAKMMGELEMPVTAAAVADYYGNLLDGYILDRQDGGEADNIAVPVKLTKTLMESLDDREQLAREVLTFAQELTAK